MRRWSRSPWILDAEEVDLEWGPRYWISIFPLTVILVAVNYEALGDAVRPLLEKWALVVPGGLLLVGAFYEVEGLRRIQVELADHRAEMRWALQTNGESPLLTDVFWISPMDYPTFVRRPSFLVPIEEPRASPPGSAR